MAKRKSRPTFIGMDTDYQAENDAHTLKRAHEVMKDKDRLAAAHGHIQKEADAMTEIASKLGKGSKVGKGGSTKSKRTSAGNRPAFMRHWNGK